jgi:mRNA-degrading endonuclease RelE of RelBE toxin-antitoxin system
MLYTVTLTKVAAKELDKLPDLVADPILKAIHNLASNPRPHGYKKLKAEMAIVFGWGILESSIQ